MEPKEPRVLVISHNAFSDSGNMGKALAGLFSGWDSARLAQLYFQQEEPRLLLAGRSYRFTDVDALGSLFPPRREGRAFCGAVTGPEREGPAWSRRLYRMGHNRRTPLVALGRDGLWRLSRWDTPRLRAWLAEFQPEVIFYAAGDHTFSYEITCAIAGRLGLPVVTVCYDDFYLQHPGGLLGRIQHRRLMSWAHRTIDGASCLLTACRPMSLAYEELFRVPCREVYPAATPWTGQPEQTGQVAYFGNLGLERWRQLVQIGRVLRSLANPGLPGVLDVYSRETDPTALAAMTPENGIRFHGGVSAEEARRKMAGCTLLVHTESFSPEMAARVKYSVSTKIGEYLASGVCILAYGPESVASVAYLRENGAAWVVTSASALEPALKEILTNAGLHREIAARGLELARKNHTPASNCRLVRAVLAEAARKGRNGG